MRNMKKVIALIMCLMLIISLTGCKTKDSYTYEEHYERVSKIIEKNYIKKGKADSYELYPVYDINDEFLYFGIDFYPKGFCFVMIRERNLSFIFGPSMYTKSNFPFEDKWQKYQIINGEKIYEMDEEGNNIYYRNSPYNISNIENEKRYLIKIGEENDNYFPAIKIGEKYLNLISKKELSIADLNKVDEIEYIIVEFWFKKDFYL